MENGKIRPRADPKPLNRSTRNSKQVITSVRRPSVQNFVQIRPLGSSRHIAALKFEIKLFEQFKQLTDYIYSDINYTVKCKLSKCIGQTLRSYEHYLV